MRLSIFKIQNVLTYSLKQNYLLLKKLTIYLYFISLFIFFACSSSQYDKDGSNNSIAKDSVFLKPVIINFASTYIDSTKTWFVDYKSKVFLLYCYRDTNKYKVTISTMAYNNVDDLIRILKFKFYTEPSTSFYSHGKLVLVYNDYNYFLDGNNNYSKFYKNFKDVKDENYVCVDCIGRSKAWVMELYEDHNIIYKDQYFPFQFLTNDVKKKPISKDIFGK